MSNLTQILTKFDYYAHASEIEPIMAELAEKRERIKTTWRSEKIRYGTFYLVDNFGWHLIPSRAKGGYRVADGMVKIEVKDGTKWKTVWCLKTQCD